ncbi:U32 family peptidase [Candidatus Pacearchaeota archaeon]|nr:U32 family peptidase [Candidatus Pacearchaeota archaeon]
MKNKKYEIMAPAGNFSMLSSAVKAGADAVYFGIKEFSMRNNAKNFAIEELDKINKICGAKIKKYLTINVIIYDEETKKIEEILKKVKGRVDAVICWDLSVINLCRKLKIPFHISTQASVSNSESAKFYKNLGAERIVLARELNLEQIKEISKIIPVECFVHGAMCVAVSGRCFMSEHLFKRSANRGMCAQVCRRSYILTDDEGRKLKINRNTVMSAKDLCSLPFIEKLKDAGITSFKIEGRNRDARYVDSVVRIYRKALDKKLTKEEIKEGLDELKKVYNRGFSSGFYLGTPTSDDFSTVENSSATTTKQFIGKVTHYYPQAKAGAILLSTGELKVGDNIAIIGNTTGIEKIKIESLEIKNSSVEKASKGEEVGIKLPKVRVNDEVYIIKEKNN